MCDYCGPRSVTVHGRQWEGCCGGPVLSREMTAVSSEHYPSTTDRAQIVEKQLSRIFFE